MNKKINNFNKFYRLNPNIKFVKGVLRGIICDLERQIFSFVPNALIEIFENNKYGKLKILINNYTSNDLDKNILIEYFNFLYEQEWIFFSSNYKLYNDLTFEYFNPSYITNSIIDISYYNNLLFFRNFISQVLELNCKFIQLRFYKNINLRKLNEFLQLFNNSIVEGIEIIVSNNKITDKEWNNLVVKFQRIKIITIYNSLKNLVISDNNIHNSKIYKIIDNLDEKKCGIINDFYFLLYD